MRVLRNEQTFEEWRPGVLTRLRASAALGAGSLCAIEQWSQPGLGAPLHVHPEDEELILVLAGVATVTVEGEEGRLGEGDTLVVAPAAWHGFENDGETVLHTLAVFPSATPTVIYRDQPDEVLEIGGGAGPHRAPRRTR
jgi:quercetin dioxygenase-like cupin family protein